MSQNITEEIKKYANKIKKLANGMLVINTTPHIYVFEDNTVVEPCGYLLNADLVESHYGTSEIDGIEFFTLNPKQNPHKQNELYGGQFIQAIVEEVSPGAKFDETKPILFLASKIAIEAYGFPVVMPTPTAETLGRTTPHSEKRMQLNKFIIRDENPGFYTTKSQRTCWANSGWS
jgi:hypothetical protein